ncbi:MAG: hypothetical protein AAF960_02260 [Bacteroidota bacterium]
MKFLFTFLFSLFMLSSYAQRVDGTWEGTITLERPTPQTEHKFQLVLKREGTKVSGTAYIFYEEQPVAMDLSGEYFGDRSMRLFNHQVLYPTQQPERDKQQHIRKYQIMYTRSVWGDKIEGYWQEINDPIFAQYRKGRVYLKRVEKTNKA